MRGFASFAITFSLLYLLWYRQFTFFRRYGLEDPPTVALNGALLFLVLFFVFPLKFFLGTMVDRLMGASKMIRLPNGAVERVIQPEHMPMLMSIYGLGFTAVSLIFCLLYVHAWRKREELQLNELELLDTRRTLEASFHTVVMGLLIVAVAQVTGYFHGTPNEDQASYAMLGVLYGYVALVIYRTRRYGKRRKAMVAKIRELATEGDAGPALQS
jgi:hypothetical protein